MAVGCMTTRVLSGAHYFSDGVAGAWIGILSGILCIKHYWYLSQKTKRGMELILNSNPPVGGTKTIDSQDVEERVQI
jgi:membrane-associated phospholipid phosphatase